jgi:glyoxylate/hydroxypyruvate reductase
MTEAPCRILIASYLEPEHVARIRAVDARLAVSYAPELLPPPRYAADHTGGPFTRAPEQEAAWQALLAEAEVLFDFDTTHRAELPDLAPRVRWIQSTSAGIGQFVRRMGYDVRMPGTVFTTAGGVHSRPLAEFCLMAMLMHNKGAGRLWREQGAHHWERYAGTDLDGRTLAIVGLGHIGSQVAATARAFGMHVIGTNATPRPEVVDRFYAPAELAALLAEAEYLVLSVPHTAETENLIGRAQLALLPDGAYVINIARGAVVDEPALIDALRSGRLSGAALDVFVTEPLPTDSPLWDMPNVLISPHSASTSDRENARLTDLFCDNLRRYLAGAPLRNVLDTQRMY